ncbi:hypothetical protein A3A20_01950 [Candidatus Wolfebacteria bacterium RIFCSPLOWO2_01_FULL_45_19]|uniref:Uncharacterized protein n=1 Tax=Candidatus Wolfebacteria bacterium RIFCSPLOWO2_01_FULL_45_19 TaxID=1802557 RepID=A0A1F8DV13_9BACT|nr:MAG: hypothetical protein A3A20_01950 [Candidatus Wolfebacteria bacterium RIFCSPLOWO2_01_FULL_45_19]
MIFAGSQYADVAIPFNLRPFLNLILVYNLSILGLCQILRSPGAIVLFAVKKRTARNINIAVTHVSKNINTMCIFIDGKKVKRKV